MSDHADAGDADVFVVRPTPRASAEYLRLSAGMQAELRYRVSQVAASPLAMLTRQSLQTPAGGVDVHVFTYTSQVETEVVVRLSFTGLDLAARRMTLVAISTVGRAPRR